MTRPSGAEGPRLSDEQRLDWLRLIRSDGIGPRTFRALVNRFGGAAAAVEALPEVTRKAGRRDSRVCSRADAARELEALRRLGGRFVAQGEPDYPRPLLAIDTAPPLLAVRGSVEACGRPAAAIVGSRNASASGGLFAERLAAALGRAGYVVVSGLARGIDTRAHLGALATGTVAVLAGGHDRVYPDENAALLERIVAEGGAAVTEMPLSWVPRGRDFPRRNRIVSGLAYAVVVVEAALRSGSLITARFAGEQGREVFAVPGSPLDPRAEGSNDLIRNGATLCAAPEHVISALDAVTGTDLARAPGRSDVGEPGDVRYGEDSLWDELDLPEVPPAPVALAAEEPDRGPPADDGPARVLSLLGPAPVAVDDLARLAEMPVRSVQALLVELELSGRVERQGGGTVAARPTRA